MQHSFDRAVEGVHKEVAARIASAKSEGATFTLADAQHLMAQAHSYDTWADFTREIEGLRSDSGKSDFERAADAVSKETGQIKRSSKKTPGIIRENRRGTPRQSLT